MASRVTGKAVKKLTETSLGYALHGLIGNRVPVRTYLDHV